MDSLKERFDFRVTWEPFLLRPNMPPEGIPKPESYLDANNPRVGSLKDAGKRAGIDFTFKSKNFPYTLKGHALLDFIKKKHDSNLQNQASEMLFHAYFTDGSAIDDVCIGSIAGRLGLNSDEILAYTNDSSVLDTVKTQATQYSQMGVSGVPYFFINGKPTFSGAQEPDVFKNMIENVASKFPLNNTESNQK